MSKEDSRSGYYPFPQPLREKLGEFLGRDGSKSLFVNLGLWSQRFVEWQEEREGRKVAQIEARSRGYGFIQQRQWGAYRELLRAYCERMKRLVRARGGKVFVYALRSRMVIGLGGADVREVGFSFHRMGFPYVPASSLKGLTRAAALLLCHSSQEEVDALLGASVSEEGQAGQVLFLDAIPFLSPEDKALLEVDVLNPHFPDYYQQEGKTEPTEWQDPNPIFFLGVPAGTAFCFGLIGEQSRVERVGAWLERGLRELGIGAKTTLGYGLWEVPRELDGRSQLSLGLREPKEGPASETPQTKPSPESAPPLEPRDKVRVGARLRARILEGASGRQGLWVTLLVEGLWEQRVFCEQVASTFRHEGLIEVEVTQVQPEIRVRFKKPL